MAASKMAPTGFWGSFMISGLYLTYEIRPEKVSGRKTIFRSRTSEKVEIAHSQLFRLVRPHFLIRKSARVSPVTFGRGHRDPEDFSRFLEGHTDKVTQLGQLSFFRVLGGQFVECVMNRQKLVVIGQGSDFHLLKFNSHRSAAVARRTLSTRRINE